MGACREGWNLLSSFGWGTFWRASWKRRWWSREHIFTDTFGRFVCAIRNGHGEGFWTDADELDWNAEQEICKTCVRPTGRLRWRNGKHPYSECESATLDALKAKSDERDKEWLAVLKEAGIGAIAWGNGPIEVDLREHDAERLKPFEALEERWRSYRGVNHDILADELAAAIAEAKR